MKLEDLTEEQMEQLPLDELQKMIDNNNIGEKVENPGLVNFKYVLKDRTLNEWDHLCNAIKDWNESWRQYSVYRTGTPKSTEQLVIDLMTKFELKFKGY